MSTGPYLLNLKRTGSGPVVVLIHGAAGGTLIWQPVTNILAKKFEVVSLDLLGFGDSPKPRIEYTPQVHTEAIHHTLEHYGITGPFAMTGLSMGCLLVLEYARRWPQQVSQLLCIGPPYFATAEEARANLRLSFNARLALEQPVMARATMGTIWKAAARSRLIASKFSKIYTPEMVRQSMKTTFQAFRLTLIHCMVENRAAPLLVATRDVRQAYLYGEQDRYMPVDRIQEMLADRPHTTLTVLPDVGHNPAVIAPELTAAWIQKTLERP